MFLQFLHSRSPMPFEKYMNFCLYHPEYGYYAQGNLPGKRGDFVTSPCIHKVFGATVSLQILEIYEILEKPKKFVIVESGAGQGYLALDILTYLVQKGFYFNYWIIEPFQKIKTIQKETLKDFQSYINWFESINEIPEFKGVFLSNELFDAFPVHLIEKQNNELKEIWIEVKKDGTIKEFLKKLNNFEIFERVKPYFYSWKDGYRTEVCTQVENFYKILSQKLKEGAIITIDYGYPRADYYIPERNRGTLLCYYRHKVIENPYFKPGEMDITAHVDFTLLKEMGEKYNFLNIGFTQQGSFLVSLGIEKVLYEVSKGNWKDIEALKFLVFPEGLGSSHWVLIQGRFPNPPKTLKGFLLSNRLYLLK